MAENEEKNPEEKEGKDAKETKAEVPKDPNEKVAKKSKLILFAGIGGVLLLALIIGGFILFKTMSAKKHAEADSTAQVEPKSQEGAENNSPDAKAKEDEKSKEDHDKKDAHKDEKKDEHKDEKKDGHKDEKKDGHKDDKGADDKKNSTIGTSNFGATYALTRMDLNLGNPIENRFLRIAVALEYRGGEEQGSEIKQREIQIKDIVITSVTSKTRVQLLTENGKELLRREILNKINEVADRPIQNVFFTEFLVE